MVSKLVVGGALEAQLRTDQTITYTELAHKLGVVEPVYPFPNNPLSEIFEELDQEDFEHKRPLRTSVVIAKELNMPGSGFFKTLDRLHGDKTPKDKQIDRWLHEYGAAKQCDYTKRF